MLKALVVSTGELLKNGKYKKYVEEALQEARDYAETAVKARTPVRTGELKANWQVGKSKTSVTFSNQTPYAAFVEYGTRRMKPRAMMQKTLPETQEVFKQAILRKLGTRLGNKVSSFTNDQADYSAIYGKPKKTKLADSVKSKARKTLSK